MAGPPSVIAGDDIRQYVAPSPAGAVPGQASPYVAPNSTAYDPNDPFGAYLNANPGRGDAWTQLELVLKSRGLSAPDVLQAAHQAIMQGLSENEAYQSIRATQGWKTRFRAITEREAKGLTPLSEDDVMHTEAQYETMMKAAGLPSGFYDSPDDFTNFLVNDVSPTELQNRLVKGYQAAAAADPQTKAALQSLYGVTDGDLAAYFLDPNKTEDLLTRQFMSAQHAGTAARTGFGQLNQQEAEGLTSLGVTNDQAATGFSDLTREHDLMTALPGETGNTITRQQQINAVFGNDANVAQDITSRGKQRVAGVRGSAGSYTENKQGFAGTGSATS